MQRDNSVAALVDENLFGRSEMCLQFADLLQRSLAHLKFPARAAVGTATYYSAKGKELFSWQHAWVRIGDEVIDGNTDCLFENPMVPKEVMAAPYWGNIKEIPGRWLRQDRAASLSPDTDVSDTWWPELREWLNKEFLQLAVQIVVHGHFMFLAAFLVQAHSRCRILSRTQATAARARSLISSNRQFAICRDFHRFLANLLNGFCF